MGNSHVTRLLTFGRGVLCSCHQRAASGRDRDRQEAETMTTHHHITREDAQARLDAEDRAAALGEMADKIARRAATR